MWSGITNVTDGRTDGQTDRRTSSDGITAPLLKHVAVKTIQVYLNSFILGYFYFNFCHTTTVCSLTEKLCLSLRLSEFSVGESVGWTVQSGWCVEVFVWWLPWAQLPVDWRWRAGRVRWFSYHADQLFIQLFIDSELHCNRRHNERLQRLSRGTYT